MHPLPIVVALNVREEIAPGLVPGRPPPLVDKFHLQGVGEALHRGIIVTVSCPAHRRLHTGTGEKLPVLTRGVLGGLKWSSQRLSGGQLRWRVGGVRIGLFGVS